jgi:hypothetical protein
MTKRKIVETVKEYDAEGRLLKETITETIENDDTQYVPYYVYTPSVPSPSYPVVYGGGDGIWGCSGGIGGNGTFIDGKQIK